jgi:glycosyltransferase involved in cell wall biosynthesis
MKIALVNDYLPSTGIGNYAFSLLSEFQKTGRDAEMVYLNYGKSNEIRDQRLKILETPWKLPILRHSLNWYYYFPKKIPSGYDIYHVSSQYLSRIAAYRKPCIITCLDLIPVALPESYPFPTRFLLKKALKQFKEAEKIITISEYTRRDVINRLEIEKNRVKAIHLGYDKDVFRKKSRSEARRKLGLPDKKIILHVGSEEPRKNIPLIIESFSTILKEFPDSLLIRVGERRRETDELIKKLNLGKNVLYRRGITKEELSLLYNAADLLVFPSSYEGFGFPVLEAMASGLPVVTSNRTSIPEVAGDACIMIKDLDPRELVEGMLRILTDKNLSENLTRKGLTQTEKFSWEKTASETIKVYEDVI